LWSRNFDASAGTTLEQSEIGRSVAAALHASLAGPPKPAPHPDPKAYEVFRQAQNAWAESSPASLQRAATLLEQAVAIDPRFALAWSQLANSEVLPMGITPADQLRRLHSAREHYARGVALDPHVVTGTSGLAYDHYILDWDWPRTEVEMRQSIKVEAGGWSHQMYATGLATRGQREIAAEQTAQATAGEPANPYLRLQAALTMRLAGDANAAAEHIHACLKINPNFFLAHIVEGYLALDRNDPAAARRAFEKAAAIDQANALPKIGLAAALASGGDVETALQLEDELARSNVGPLFSRAITHVALGDTDGALTLLEQSAQWRESQVLWLTSDPLLAPLRNDRRFKALVQRMGL
jgi:serine/threonine-protein kinase